MSENSPKIAYEVTHRKSATPNQKIFFKYRLEDWPIRFSPWTALQCNRRRSYGVGKATDNCWI